MTPHATGARARGTPGPPARLRETPLPRGESCPGVVPGGAARPTRSTPVVLRRPPGRLVTPDGCTTAWLHHRMASPGAQASRSSRKTLAGPVPAQGRTDSRPGLLRRGHRRPTCPGASLRQSDFPPSVGRRTSRPGATAPSGAHPRTLDRGNAPPGGAAGSREGTPRPVAARLRLGRDLPWSASLVFPAGPSMTGCREQGTVSALPRRRVHGGLPHGTALPAAGPGPVAGAPWAWPVP
jgi:hypothetical protein